MSLFTNYRPNFCAECGEKIVRLRWSLWTSRRFCDKCAARFVRAQGLRRATAALALIAIGLLIGRGWRQEQPPLVIQRTASAPAQNSPVGSSAAAAPVVAEQIYMCGARTKKGTPCSRRVHGPVRCWQHKGLPAMLPQEKLLIKE